MVSCFCKLLLIPYFEELAAVALLGFLSLTVFRSFTAPALLLAILGLDTLGLALPPTDVFFLSFGG